MCFNYISLLSLLIGRRIARNIGNFETWSTFQGCDQVSYSDVPKELKADVDQIFDLTRKLPIVWTDKVLLCISSGKNHPNNLSDRAQMHTEYLSSLHHQSFWYSFKMRLKCARVYSLIELMLKLVQNSLLRLLSSLLLGGVYEACVIPRRNGQKQTLLRTCMSIIFDTKYNDDLPLPTQLQFNPQPCHSREHASRSLHCVSPAAISQFQQNHRSCACLEHEDGGTRLWYIYSCCQYSVVIPLGAVTIQKPEESFDHSGCRKHQYRFILPISKYALCTTPQQSWFRVRE